MVTVRASSGSLILIGRKGLTIDKGIFGGAILTSIDTQALQASCLLVYIARADRVAKEGARALRSGQCLGHPPEAHRSTDALPQILPPLESRNSRS